MRIWECHGIKWNGLHETESERSERRGRSEEVGAKRTKSRQVIRIWASNSLHNSIQWNMCCLSRGGRRHQGQVDIKQMAVSLCPLALRQNGQCLCLTPNFAIASQYTFWFRAHPVPVVVLRDLRSAKNIQLPWNVCSRKPNVKDNESVSYAVG